MTEQISKTHNSVLTVLDEERLGSVTDVDLFTRVGDGACDLTLAFLVSDTFWVALLETVSDQSPLLAPA